MKKQVTIYTDGACSGNPGPGGWGCILMYNQHRKESSGGALNTTNNRMEITAALEALKLLKEPCRVDLYTDSAYLCNALEKKWLDTWSKNGWKTASKSNVENQDLWKELIVELDRHDVQFQTSWPGMPFSRSFRAKRAKTAPFCYFSVNNYSLNLSLTNSCFRIQP